MMPMTDPLPSSGRPQPMRVVVADRHAPMRAYVQLQFETWLNFRLVAETASGLEALRWCRTGVNVLILDLCLREVEADAVLATLREEKLPVRTLLYTDDMHGASVCRAVRAHPHGLVFKTEPLEFFRRAVDAVASGGSYRSPGASEWEERLEAEPAWPKLPARELSVLHLLAEGTLTKEIGDHLHVSTKTVEHARSVLLKAFGAKDGPSLIRAAMRSGLIC